MYTRQSNSGRSYSSLLWKNTRYLPEMEVADRDAVRDMFSHDFDYEDLTEKVDKVDFHGNDGVCLFKYFFQALTK